MEELQELGGCSRGLVTVFVIREVVMTEDYIWGVVSMSMQLVWMKNMSIGYRGLESVLVTRQGVNMMVI